MFSTDFDNHSRPPNSWIQIPQQVSDCESLTAHSTFMVTWHPCPLLDWEVPFVGMRFRSQTVKWGTQQVHHHLCLRLYTCDAERPICCCLCDAVSHSCSRTRPSCSRTRVVRSEFACGVLHLSYLLARIPLQMPQGVSVAARQLHLLCRGAAHQKKGRVIVYTDAALP